MKNELHAKWILRLVIGVLICLTYVLSGAMAGVTEGKPDVFVCDDIGGLWVVDVNTGDATLIGNTGPRLTDIAFSPSGDLYGIDLRTLYRIDPDTARITFIGLMNTSRANALTFSPDGTLYTADLDGQFWTVDTSNGRTTLVGNIGFASAGDLAFAPDGTLYLTTEDHMLITVDPETGAGNLVGPIGFIDVFGADFIGDTLYGFTFRGEVIVMDPDTGAGTLVALTNPTINVNGMALRPCAGCVR